MANAATLKRSSEATTWKGLFAEQRAVGTGSTATEKGRRRRRRRR
jgi:hypothetical protein